MNFFVICFVMFFLTLLQEKTDSLILISVIGVLLAPFSNELTLQSVPPYVKNFLNNLFSHVKRNWKGYACILLLLSAICVFSVFLSKAAQRKSPDFLTFIIDNSGSMGCNAAKFDGYCSSTNSKVEESKVEDSKDWVKSKINNLDVSLKRTSIIEIGGKTPSQSSERCLINTPLAAGIHSQEQLISAVENIRPNDSGASDLGGAIKIALLDINAFRSEQQPQKLEKKIIVLTDQDYSCDTGTDHNDIINSLDLGATEENDVYTEDRIASGVFVIQLAYKSKAVVDIKEVKVASLATSLRYATTTDKQKEKMGLESIGVTFKSVRSKKELDRLMLQDFKLYKSYGALNIYSLSNTFLPSIAFLAAMILVSLERKSAINEVRNSLGRSTNSSSLRRIDRGSKEENINALSSPSKAVPKKKNLEKSSGQTALRNSNVFREPKQRTIQFSRDNALSSLVIMENHSFSKEASGSELDLQLHVVLLDATGNPRYRNRKAHVCSKYFEHGTLTESPWARLVDNSRYQLKQNYNLEINPDQVIEINPYRGANTVEYLLVLSRNSYMNNTSIPAGSCTVTIAFGGTRDSQMSFTNPFIENQHSWHICKLSFPEFTVDIIDDGNEELP